MIIEKNAQEKNTFIEYDYVSFSVYKGKVYRYFTKEPFKEIGFKIYPHDKEKVHHFLQSIL